MENNVFDTALILEGGGMKASYTAGIINTLLENKIYFDYVIGVSAGSSHCVNYLSRDKERVKKSFVDIVKDPNFGGWKSFMKGEGYFNAYHLYEGIADDNSLPFRYEDFFDNPARIVVPSFNSTKGKTIYWTKEDMPNTTELMKRVRSSSTIPFLMKPCIIDDEYYFDGGLGENGGILIDKAKKDGFKKFFLVLSHEKGFRHKEVAHPHILKKFCKDNINLYNAMIDRHTKYNKTMDEIDRLEEKGLAYVIRPSNPIGNLTEKNVEKLEELYINGYEYGKRNVDKWIKFLY